MDRAALDFAIESGIEHGGWCPLGRIAEDGLIPERYHLHETPTSDYADRTERNVLDSDATLIIGRDSELAGGTLFTAQMAQKHRKPCLVVREADGVENAAASIQGFVDQNAISSLNVAGPRNSESPGIVSFVRAVLAAATLTK